jgi:hypothetical protein
MLAELLRCFGINRIIDASSPADKPAKLGVEAEKVGSMLQSADKLHRPPIEPLSMHDAS